MSQGSMSVKARFEEVSSKVKRAQSRSKLLSQVRVLAVSKRQTVGTMKLAIECGQTDFAENYFQEAFTKQAQLSCEGLTWHFIGTIQSKKAKQLVGKFDYIHSVDRLKVANALNKSCEDLGVFQKILVQVNLAGEGSKSGLKEPEVNFFFKDLESLRHLKVCGLMIMPPATQQAESNRIYFQRARELLQQLKAQFSFLGSEFCQLSMGTSQDYEVAVEEGATMIRLGTQLLGERKH